MSLLSVTELSVAYDGDKVVENLSFDVAAGEAVGILGGSGAGKSQTALAILGLLPAQAAISGSVRLDGQELLGADSEALNALRAQRISMVFQDPMLALNPYLRIGKQLQQILLFHRIAKGEKAKQQVIDMLRRVGLPDPQRQYRAFPHELSGGMRQRVMIASALIAKPDLLVADEPTTALDVTVQAQILDLLEELRDDTALLLISHDLGILASRCERLLVMESGNLIESGATLSILSAPVHASTRALVDAAPRMSQKLPARKLADVGDPRKLVLGIDAATVTYTPPRQPSFTAVREVSLSLVHGETLALVGESGSGKSSLVRAVLGLIPLKAGSVVYAGEKLEGPVRSRSINQRRDLQLVFQDPLSALNPEMCVADIIAEPLRVHEAGQSRTARQGRVLDALQQVDLDEQYLQRYPHQLSGGEGQRVAIARAMVVAPQVLICDEAVASLDGATRTQVLQLLSDVQERTGLSIIFISHDLAVVREFSDRVAVMYLGRLVEVADNFELFNNPRHPYTRALIDAVPSPDPRESTRAAPLRGEVPSPATPPAGCVFHPRCAHANPECSKQIPPLQQLDKSQVACIRAAELPA